MRELELLEQRYSDEGKTDDEIKALLKICDSCGEIKAPNRLEAMNLSWNKPDCFSL
jgi:hypothetical protein